MRPVVMLAPLLLAAACGGDTEADASGRNMYLRYCASCHGQEGRGDGSLAPALTRLPTDLTQLAKENDGHYDERAVMSAIDGRRRVIEHGTRDMPVWGAIFEEEGSTEPYPAYHSLLQSRLLVDYLATIQEQ